jgi:hypothetical protein
VQAIGIVMTLLFQASRRGLPLGLQITHRIGHQLAEILGLMRERLKLRLRVPALEGQHVLDILCSGKLSCQREGAFGVLIGEGNCPLLDGAKS